MKDSTAHNEGTIDPHMMTVLRDIANVCIYPPDTLLTHQGESERTFYVLESGSAVVTRQMEDGREQVLNTLGPLQSFGEMALLDDSPRLATVKTLTEATVLEITAERFRTIIKEDPDIALYITRTVLASFRKLDQSAIRDLREKNALLQQAYFDLQAAQAAQVEKERLEHEMELAAEMQCKLLPATLPIYPGYNFKAYLVPARYAGGDLYDVRPLDDEHVALLIADVADKGMHAALMMAVTRTLFFREAYHSRSPSEVAYAVHQGLLGISGSGGAMDGYGVDAFVTAFYGVLHLPTGRLTYVRAAQDRPLLARLGQAPVSLPGGGRFLGMLEELTLAEYEINLQAGDHLLLYSDGVTDAMNEHDESFGLDRLVSAYQKAINSDEGDILASLTGEILNWRGAAPAFDDVTMLLVEVAC
ncbi:MAG: SpoIIE family protein phosphatase [Candidatus Promineofilum sp.]|nr:SpoIIE family protein phosphatase [Promineifilum sp.]MBP9656728.1 SpoIIE family protein phosphatase [Promineifilum sp.]